MLIWYGNVGEETVYFQNRIDNFPVLFYGNLIINFFFPFLILFLILFSTTLGVSSERDSNFRPPQASQTFFLAGGIWPTLGCG